MKSRILLIATLFLAISSIAVFAQTGQQNGGDMVTSGQGGENSQKCTDVTRKVGLVTERYNQVQGEYAKAFQNIEQTMTTVALKFKADGYDTTQLEAHLAQYSNMIKTMNEAYNSFRNGIENTKQGVCGNSPEDAGQTFTEARTQLRACKNEMLELRTYAEETLREDLEDLKNQVTE